MYIPTPAHQTYIFFLCTGFGFLLGLFYHFIRFLRMIITTSKKGIYIQDAVFCLFSTFALICFLLCCNDGEIRFFELTGFALGMVIYLFTFGTFVKKYLTLFSVKIRKILCYPLKRIKKSKKHKKVQKKHKNKLNNT